MIAERIKNIPMCSSSVCFITMKLSQRKIQIFDHISCRLRPPQLFACRHVIFTMQPTLLLSVLDQTPIRAGSDASEALQETIQLARWADRLGYRRYWLSEHHNTTTLAGASPGILIARLAAETKHIRLGSGGIMLPNHSTLKVAEDFRLLEALYPGRIDLGLGRAPGGDRITAQLL